MPNPYGGFIAVYCAGMYFGATLTDDYGRSED